MNEGRIGQWTTVEVQLPPAGSSSLTAESEEVDLKPPTEDIEDTRGWKFDGAKRRRIAIGLDDIYDPGEIKVKRKEGESPPTPSEVKADEDPTKSGATSVPSWTPKTWAKPGEIPLSSTKSERPEQIDGIASTSTIESGGLKKEAGETTSLDYAPSDSATNIGSASTEVKKEESVPPLSEPIPTSNPTPESSSGLFRKRKAPGAGASSRGTRR